MSGISLYPYQERAVDAILGAWRGGMRRPGLAMSTGGGKTIVFARAIDVSQERTLVIAHRKELIDQAVQKIGYMIDPSEIGVVMAERNQRDRPIVVASIQTIANPRRLHQLGQFGLVVIDEAHHAVSPSWMRTLAALGVGKGLDTKALGVTATWDRADRLAMDQVFDAIVCTVGLEQLIASGHLADIQAQLIHTELDTQAVRGNGSGDFNAEDLGRRIVDSNYADTLAAAVDRFARDRICLVFAPNIAASEVFRDALLDVGIAAACVSGMTPKHERERAIDDLAHGRLRAIVNVGVFTEGTDIPIVDCIVMGRPTQSRALYQQMAGRGLRRYPGKQNCMILDLVGNSGRLQLQTAASLIGRTPPQNTREIASFRSWLEEPEPAEAPDLGGFVDTTGVLGGAFTQRAETVELIDRSRLAWSQVEIDTFALSAGGDAGQIVIRGDNRGTFDVIQFGTDRSRRELGHGLDIGYAQGVAEKIATDAGAAQLVDPNARWRKRKEPATEKQRSALAKWKIAIPADCTKVQASDLLDAAITRANLKRRYRPEASHVDA